MADISPNVITKLNQVMFSSNEPPITSVIWAKPDGTSKRSYTFLAFSEGKWRTLSSGGGDIPQNISYFYNDVGYITMADLPEFSDVAISGSYNDLLNKPYIPAEVTESTVAGWGFTKNTGTYSKPSGGIPSSDMSSAVQTSLGKADTALQTETDPTVPSWAKASSKPSYTAQEVGALPSSTVIPTITFRQW